jgi:putative ABC transport system permease protein
MRFLALILRNVLRRRTRSAFTVLGISLGIATIVALGALMSGMTSSMEEVLKTGEADFSITQSGVADLSFSKIEANRTEEIAGLDGIERVAGVLIAIYPFEGNPYTFVWGAEQENLEMLGVTMTNGSVFSRDSEAILGRIAAEEMNKTVNDSLLVKQEEFNITGVFETGGIYQDKGIALPLSKLQQMEKKEGYVTVIYAELEEGADVQEVCRRIEEQFPDLATIRSASELGKVDKGLELMDAVSSAVSLLSLLIGGIGVTNTMMMSIHERTREIGVLRAVGWKRKRVLTMILGESTLLCLFSVLIGSVLGILGTQLLLLHPLVRGILQPAFTVDVFIRGFAVAIAVGLVGGIYPAHRASKLAPSEALRYE